MRLLTWLNSPAWHQNELNSCLFKSQLFKATMLRLLEWSFSDVTSCDINLTTCRVWQKFRASIIETSLPPFEVVNDAQCLEARTIYVSWCLMRAVDEKSALFREQKISTNTFKGLIKFKNRKSIQNRSVFVVLFTYKHCHHQHLPWFSSLKSPSKLV